LTLVDTDPRFYGEFLSRLNDKAIKEKLNEKNIYEVTMMNKGGLVMPVILQWNYKDGSTEIEKIPAEVWRLNESKFSKVFVKEKEVVSVIVDPKLETSDVNVEDNVFPRVQKPSKFDDFKKKKS